MSGVELLHVGVWLPWILTGFTCLNIWLLGRLRREGFLVGLAAQPVWLIYVFENAVRPSCAPRPVLISHLRGG